MSEALINFLTWAVPIIVSCIFTTVVAFLIKRWLTKYFEKVDNEREEKEADAKRLKELEEQEKEKALGITIEKAVDKVVKPLNKKIDDLDKKMELDRKSTITVMRSKMKTLRDQYKSQGFADAGDKATWEELYHDYADMGGNHFREWVDQWREEVRALPLEAPHDNN